MSYFVNSEIIPGLLLGGADDAGKMVRQGADVLVPLAFLDGRIWETGFRGEILYYPIEDRNVLPTEVLHELVDKICDRLEAGKKVGLFCGAGQGRTGYVAACVLARHGIKDPISYIRRNYSRKAIETDRQANEVFSYVRGLRAEQIRSEGQKGLIFEYESYHGDEPYLYLSFSEWDTDIAIDTIRVLNESGFNVAYDKAILEGRLWSRGRSDKIEDCSLFVTISTPCESNSHIRLADYYFAELLEKPMITIKADDRYWSLYTDETEGIGSRPDQPDFAEKCIRGFARKGMQPNSGALRSDESEPGASEGKTADTGEPGVEGTVVAVPNDQGSNRIKLRSFKGKRKERRWDLGITYYEHYGDQDRMFSRERQRDCNLRTHEVYDNFKNKLDDASDEELYRAIGWKLVRFDLFPRHDNMIDYISDRADMEFRRRLCAAGGKPIPEIQAEYKKAQKEIDDFWRDYPYMDEFEYMDSLHKD